MADDLTINGVAEYAPDPATAWQAFRAQQGITATAWPVRIVEVP